jgi:2'-5' RNA ligase
VNKPPDKLRLFFALQPAPELKSALVESVAPLVAQLQGQRVLAENLHATLCFIGSTAPEDVGKLVDVAARQHGRRVTLHFDSLDFWQKPRILCATANEDSGSAAPRELAENLASGAKAAGFTLDARPFRAHLTLARKVHASLAAQGEWPRPLAPAVVMRFDRFVQMESRSGESGSTYSVVNSWPLYAGHTD